MLEETEDQRIDIENAKAIRDLLSSKGWSIIEPILKEKKESIVLKRSQSDDPAIVMACVRQEDGIMFINEVIHDLIERGDEALKESAE